MEIFAETHFRKLFNFSSADNESSLGEFETQDKVKGVYITLENSPTYSSVYTVAIQTRTKVNIAFITDWIQRATVTSQISRANNTFQLSMHATGHLESFYFIGCDDYMLSRYRSVHE